jgi:Protein of unknown function DUF262
MPFDQDLNEDDQTELINISAADRKLVTQSYDLSVGTLIEQWTDHTLILPDIQREYVWNNAKASRLIESLLLNVPIPVLYFAELGDQYEVIDGHQRVSSIVRYVNNEFRLYGLKVLADEQHKGMRFHQLPIADQRRIRTRVIRAIIITEESHPSMKFEVFERLNSGSISLNAQEVRNSTHRGPFIVLVKELVHDKTFRGCVGSTQPRRRMVDNELIVRFFAFSDRLKTYRPPLQRFLNDYCATQNEKNDEALEADADRFRHAALCVFTLFGKNSFRLTDTDGALIDKNLNRALAETQLVTMAKLSVDEVRSSRQALLVQLGALHRNEDFLDNIQRATGDRARTLGRMRLYAEACRRAGIQIDL